MGGAVSSGNTNDELIDNLIDGTCIRSRDVERAFRMVDRADYFLPRSRGNAYKDVAWKSGHYHLSAPCVYSEVMEGLCLKSGNRFLNIGSGTGYLSTMAGLLLGATGINHGIELHEDLVQYARHKLGTFKKYSGAIDEFDFCEPHFAVGNGLCLSHGKSGDYREYDRVYCGAACPEAFEAQVWRLVAVGGILVMPCNDQLLQLRRTAADTWDACPLLGVTFATLVPPVGDAHHQHSEHERKDHRKIALTLFAVGPPSLQHLCRSLIRDTVRSAVVAADPSVYKAASRPRATCAKSVLRRGQRARAATEAAVVEEDEGLGVAAGTQRVTLSLGGNGRLNIDRGGANTEAARRARMGLLGRRWVNAREGAGEGDRRATAQTVENNRVERLLEHLCQEMIIVPGTPDHVTRDIESEMGVIMNLTSTIQMELDHIQSRQNDVNCEENVEPHPCTSKSDLSNRTELTKSELQDGKEPLDLLSTANETLDTITQLPNPQNTSDMDTSSEHERDIPPATEHHTNSTNKTPVSRSTTHVTNDSHSPPTPNNTHTPTDTNRLSTSSIVTPQCSGSSSFHATMTQNKYRLAGFRFHNTPHTDGATNVRKNTDGATNTRGATNVRKNTDGATDISTNTDGATNNIPNTRGATNVRINTDGGTSNIRNIGANTDGATNNTSNTRGATNVRKNTDGATNISTNTDGATNMSTNTDGATTNIPNTRGATNMSTNTDGATNMSTNTDGATNACTNTDGGTSTSTNTDGGRSGSKQSSKRSSSSSSLKKSSKRRSHRDCAVDSGSADDSEWVDTSSDSSSSSDTMSGSSSDDDSAGDNDGGRPRLVCLSEIFSRDNILSEFSTDEDSDGYTSSGRVSGQEEAAVAAAAAAAVHEPQPVVARSAYTGPMVGRIRALPLPKRLQVYVNYDRDLTADEEDEMHLDAAK